MLETWDRVCRGVPCDEPNGSAEEDVIGEDKIGAGGVRLVVTEAAVVVAIRRHIRFECRWDGWEEVGAKGEWGRAGWQVGCRERSRGK